jgi:hypothetical protein
MEKAAFVATLLFFAAPATAAQESYACTVQSLSRLSDGGTLVRATGDPIEGRDFAVNRASGKIIGKYLGSGGFDTKVLDAGSAAQSFKVLATSRGSLHVLYLEIQQFRPGVLKPFVLVDGSLVYAGVCK